MPVDVDVNIKGHNESLLRSFAEASAASDAFDKRISRGNNARLTDEQRFSKDMIRQSEARMRQLERETRDAERQHERTRRSFLAGIAPGGRRATGVAGLAGIITSGTLAAAPISGSVMSALSTLPALTAGIAPLAGLLPAIGVGAAGAAQGMGVLMVATNGLMKVIEADTPQKLATALKALDPETRKLAYAFHQELHPAMKRIEELAQKTVLPSLFKMGQAMEGLTKPGKAIYDGFKATGDGISKVVNSITNLLNDKAFGKQLDHLMVGLGDGIGKLGHILPPVLDLFVRIGNLALPFANKMGDAIGRWVDKLDDFVQHHGKEVTQFFQTAYATAQDWAHGMGDVLGIFAGLTRAAGPLSHALGAGINAFLDKLNGLINSAAGQRGLKAFFADAFPTLKSFGKLVSGLVEDLGKLGADPRTQAFLRSVFDFASGPLLGLLNEVASAIPGIAHAVQPALGVLGEFVNVSLKPLVTSMLGLVKSALPPLVPLLRSIADILRVPLDELTHIVDLLAKALTMVGHIGGSNGFGGILELGLLGVGAKAGPKLVGKMLSEAGLKKGVEAAVPTAEKLGDTAILAAFGSNEARRGFTGAASMGRDIIRGSGTFAELGAAGGGSIAVEGAAGAATVKSAVDGALAYLRGHRAKLTEPNMITGDTAAARAYREGLIIKPTDPVEGVGPRKVYVRYKPVGSEGPTYRAAVGPRGEPIYGAAARNTGTANVIEGASTTRRAPSYRFFQDGGGYSMKPLSFGESLKDFAGAKGEKFAAGMTKAIEAFSKVGKVFVGFQAAMAGLAGVDTAVNHKGGFFGKVGAGLGASISNLASPLVAGPWWSRLGAGALAGGGVGGLPGAAVGIGLEAGSLLSDHVGGHIADFAGKNALQAKDIQKSIKDWNLAAVPAKLHKAILDSYESSNKEGFAKFADSVRAALGRLPQLVKGMSPSFVKAFLSPIEQAASQAGSVFDNLRAGMGESLHIIATDMGAKSKMGTKAMVAAFVDMQMKVGTAEKNMMISVGRGNAFVKAQAIDILKAMGYKNIGSIAKDIMSAKGASAFSIASDAGLVSPDGGNNHAGANARGGYYTVGSEKAVGGDTVPAIFNGRPAVVAKGENIAVFNRHQRAELNQRLADVGGLRGFFESRRKKHTDIAAYSTGGTVDSGDGFFPAAGTNYTQGQEPQIAARLNRLAHALHLHLIGISGYRSPHHSVEVGGFANDPHTRGAASDTPGIEGISEKILERYGLTRPFGGAREADHIQLLGSALGGAGGALAAALGGSGSGPGKLRLVKPYHVKLGGVVGTIAQAAVDLARKAANDKIRRAHASMGGAGDFSGIQGGGTSGANEALGRRMMLAMGWPSSEWPALKALWTRESGWNQNALNPSSGAYGIPQALGHGHVFGPNPKDQIAWGLDYIKGRYGSPSGAWAHEQQVGWYSPGGDATDGITGSALGKDLGSGMTVPSSVLNPPKKKKGAKKSKKAPYTSGPAMPTAKQLAGVTSKKSVGAKVPGLTKRLKKLGNLIGNDTQGKRVQAFFDSLASAIDPYDEQATLSMYDGDPVDHGVPDLTNYLNAHPEALRGQPNAAAWIATYGNSLEVLNATDPSNLMGGSGLNFQGVFAAGIPEHLRYDKKLIDGYKQYLLMAGPTGLMGDYGGDLEFLHREWEHYDQLKQEDTYAVNRYESKHMTWDEKVNVAEGKKKLWEKYLTDLQNSAVSHRLTGRAQKNRIKAHSEIKKLNAEIAHDKSTKPKAVGDPPKKRANESVADFNHRLSEYNHRNQQNTSRLGRTKADIMGYDNALSYISGDTSAWGTNGGIASQFKDAIDNAKTNMAEVVTSLLPGLYADVKQWSATRINPIALDSGGGSAGAAKGLQDGINETLAKNLALASAQFDVFKGFAPLVGARMIGAFDHGGVVPRTGMALVHKGEFINPAPQGPYRNGINSAGSATGGGDTHLELHLHGGLDAVVERGIMKHGSKLIRLTSEQQGRRTRLISSAPGGRGR